MKFNDLRHVWFFQTLRGPQRVPGFHNDFKQKILCAMRSWDNILYYGMISLWENGLHERWTKEFLKNLDMYWPFSGSEGPHRPPSGPQSTT